MSVCAGTNGIMNVWEVNTAALLPPQPGPGTLAASSSSKPDWEQLVGDPALYEELRDYFCYAQLTTQQLDTTGGFGIDGEPQAHHDGRGCMSMGSCMLLAWDQVNN